MKSIYSKYSKIGIIFWAICFLILLLSYLLVMAPQEKILRMTEQKLADTKFLAQSAQEAAQEEYKNLLSEHLSSSTERLKDFVIEQDNIGNLTLEIGRIAKKVGLDSFGSDFTTGERITTKTDSSEHIFPRYISVKFNSSFNNFADFLNRLERSEPVYFIDTFSINRSEENESANPVEMKLAVLVGKDA